MRIVLTLLGLFWAFLLLITGTRFLILLFDANRDSEIVDWVLRKSDFWVKPFFDLLGMTNKALEETGGVFEPASLIAFLFYFVVGGFILSVLSRTYYGGFGWWHDPTYHRV
jgi:hypothetical protein